MADGPARTPADDDDAADDDDGGGGDDSDVEQVDRMCGTEESNSAGAR